MAIMRRPHHTTNAHFANEYGSLLTVCLLMVSFDHHHRLGYVACDTHILVQLWPRH